MSYNVAQVITGTLYRNIFNRNSDSAGFQVLCELLHEGKEDAQ